MSEQSQPLQFVTVSKIFIDASLMEYFSENSEAIAETLREEGADLNNLPDIPIIVIQPDRK